GRGPPLPRLCATPLHRRAAPADGPVPQGTERGDAGVAPSARSDGCQVAPRTRYAVAVWCRPLRRCAFHRGRYNAGQRAADDRRPIRRPEPWRAPTVITSLVGQPVDALDTPALLVDRDAFRANIDVMTSSLRATGTGWRPHAKAHKSPAIAHL